MSQTQTHGLLERVRQGGSAPWPGVGRSPVMLHRPQEEPAVPRSWRGRERTRARSRRSWRAGLDFVVAARRSRDSYRRSCLTRRPRPGSVRDSRDLWLQTPPVRRPRAGALLRMRFWGPSRGPREGCPWGL
ncbi:LOW QUALITY PROTEIN: uncharacterized protein LOC100441133 [Pongo abelii]|uniref:LOW QUALITY PROTEIN: uncharacterized protein LOC100441133 n=1 Tax=Pongo abelii TaxID=9601 RepID=UPI0023E7D438|nr:LOW QUALITY PROTEIN: uncharacterized protein LOC100441133 [Pongo abelii]